MEARADPSATEDAKKYFLEGVRHSSAGSFDLAEESFKHSLEILPGRVSTLNNLTAVQIELNKLPEARTNCGLALAADPTSDHGWLNNGLIQFKEGDAKAARRSFITAIRRNRRNHLAWFYLGGVYDLSNKLKKSLRCYQIALQINDGYTPAIQNLGACYNELGQYSDSIELNDRLLKSNKDDLIGRLNRAVALFSLGELDEALVDIDVVLRASPRMCEAWSNKGLILHGKAQYAQALEHHTKALSLGPQIPDLYMNRARTLACVRRFEEAISDYQSALNLDPESGEAYTNLGNAYLALGNNTEARRCHKKATVLSPNVAGIWVNFAHFLGRVKDYPGAISAIQRALSLDARIPYGAASLLANRLKICDWTDYDVCVRTIEKEVDAQEESINPFSFLAISDSPNLQRLCSEKFAETFTSPAPKPNAGANNSQRIKIGYFSADIGNHPVARLIVGLLELHDRSRFELILFTLLKRPVDALQDRIVRAVDRVIDISQLDTLEAIEITRRLSLDIAVDLQGYTLHCRPEIFAHRIAPLQINYLGYPGTMGADFIDYLIADRFLIPDEYREFYSEKVIYLPSCYQPNDHKRPAAKRAFTRAALGLPDDSFVYCSFNNPYKINPVVFAAWMRILSKVPNSILWLYIDNSVARDSLLSHALSAGITANRIVFAESMSQELHISRLREADLFLDTFPYNAHTTASDALWARLPVLTLTGKSFASRVAGSILKSADMSSLITYTLDDYEKLAVELALDSARLAKLKERLSQGRDTTPLFNTERYTKNYEKSLFALHERHCLGYPIEDITVS